MCCRLCPVGSDQTPAHSSSNISLGVLTLINIIKKAFACRKNIQNSFWSNLCLFQCLLVSPTLSIYSSHTFLKEPKTAAHDQPAQRASTHLCPQVLPIFARRVSSTSTKGKPHLNLNNSASLLFPRIKTRGVGLHRKSEPQKPGRAPFGPAGDARAPLPPGPARPSPTADPRPQAGPRAGEAGEGRAGPSARQQHEIHSLIGIL